MWEKSNAEIVGMITQGYDKPYQARLGRARPVALIDIDSVVADLWNGINEERRKVNLSQLCIPQEWGMADLGKDVQSYCFRLFRSTRFYSKLKPMPGARDGLWLLDKEYDIVYITARGWDVQRGIDHNMHSVTVKWLFDNEFPEGLIYYTTTDNKGSYARRNLGTRIAFAVEDSPLSVGSYASNGIFTYLMSYAYNMHIEDEMNVKRVSTFSDVVEDLRQAGALDAGARFSDDDLFNQFIRDPDGA
jgi:hypothetical protein